MNYITSESYSELYIAVCKPSLSPKSRIIFSALAFIKNKNKRLGGQEYKIKLLEGNARYSDNV